MLGANRHASGRVPCAHPEDLELIRNSLNGDSGATEELCARLQCIPRMVNGLNVRMNSAVGSDELRDVCQQVIVLVWRKREAFNGDSSIESWVLGFVRYELLTAARQTNRRQLARDVDTLEEAAAPAAAKEVDSELLALALARIDVDDARIVRLRVFQDAPFEAIGARLGVTPSAARNRYYRSLRALRERLTSMARGVWE